MKLIIGLGNPGKNYEYNRHNVGYLFIDFLSHKKISKSFIIKKTNAFMNNSGSLVKSLSTSYKLSSANIYVAHDDLDLKLGEYKITQKSPKDHKGVNSVKEELDSDDFYKIRIGIDSRDLENKEPGESYVLNNFTKDELEVLQTVFPKIYSDLIK